MSNYTTPVGDWNNGVSWQSVTTTSGYPVSGLGSGTTYASYYCNTCGQQVSAGWPCTRCGYTTTGATTYLCQIHGYYSGIACPICSQQQMGMQQYQLYQHQQIPFPMPSYTPEQMAEMEEAQKKAKEEYDKVLKTKSFKVGEIIGWRGWIDQGGHLRSLGMNTFWAPGEPMEGKPAGHDGPGCYSFKKLRQYLDAFNTTYVYGQVALWGDVIEHELGYRSEYAKIVSIDYHPRGPWALRKVRKRYKVGARIT